MVKYRIQRNIECSWIFEIEADNIDEAIDKAEQIDLEGLEYDMCHETECDAEEIEV